MKISRGYKILLWIYPPDYRALFGEEMMTVFEEAAEERREHGGAVFVWFAFTELTGLLIGAGAEWIAKFTCATYQLNRPASAAAAYSMVQRMRPPWVTQAVFFKTIDLIGGVGERVNARRSTPPDEVIEAEKRVEFLLGCIVKAISGKQFRKARFYSDLESKERENLHLLRRRYRIK